MEKMFCYCEVICNPNKKAPTKQVLKTYLILNTAAQLHRT